MECGESWIWLGLGIVLGALALAILASLTWAGDMDSDRRARP